jgi:FkbM family methyltransferase
MQMPAAVKRLTNPVVGRVRVPILSGPNRGLWWSLASAGSGYATGRRAARQMELVASLVGPGDVVWDIGAHHGFVTLCAARRVGRAGEVHAFEPSSGNLWFIARHLRWNGVDNATVHPFALSSFEGECRFGGGRTSKLHALGNGNESVRVCTGQSLIRSGAARAPTFVKIDVEGAEGAVLAGVIEMLRRDTILLIAMHSRAAHDECTAILETAGFTMLPSRALRASLAGTWRSDPDMLCVGPAHPVGELTHRLLEAAGFD